jgi:hypothetical protein
MGLKNTTLDSREDYDFAHEYGNQAGSAVDGVTRLPDDYINKIPSYIFEEGRIIVNYNRAGNIIKIKQKIGK